MLVKGIITILSRFSEVWATECDGENWMAKGGLATAKERLLADFDLTATQIDSVGHKNHLLLTNGL